MSATQIPSAVLANVVSRKIRATGQVVTTDRTREAVHVSQGLDRVYVSVNIDAHGAARDIADALVELLAESYTVERTDDFRLTLTAR